MLAPYAQALKRTSTRVAALLWLASVPLLTGCDDPAARAAPARAVKIRVKPRPVGSRAVETYRFAVKVKVDAMYTPNPPVRPPTSEKYTVVREHRYQRETKILARRGRAITRLEVRYLDAREKTGRVGQVKTRVLPVKGKTYVLSYARGRLRAQRGGRPASAAELAYLRRVHPDLGQTPVWMRVLRRCTAANPMLRPRKAELGHLVGFPSLPVLSIQLKPAAITILPANAASTPRTQRRYLAMLGYEKQGGPNGGPMGVASLKGGFSYRTDGGWPLRVSLTGSVDVTLTPPDTMVMGKGNVTVDRTFRYR